MDRQLPFFDNEAGYNAHGMGQLKSKLIPFQKTMTHNNEKG